MATLQFLKVIRYYEIDSPERIGNTSDILLNPPSDLYDFIKWLSPAFETVEQNKNISCPNPKITESDSFHSIRDAFYLNKIVIPRNHSMIAIHTVSPIHLSQHRQHVHDNEYDAIDNQFNYGSNVSFIDESTSERTIDHKESDDDDPMSLSSIDHLSAFQFGLLLSQQLQSQMIRCRLASLIKLSHFEHHIVHRGLLRDILRVIVEFELGMNDSCPFIINFLNNAITKGTTSYISYILGCYESLCMFCVLLIHATSVWHSYVDALYYLDFMLISWMLCLLTHIFGAIHIWRRAHSISPRVKQLKIVLEICQNSNIEHYDEEEQQQIFDDIDGSEAFCQLMRWCNLSEIRLNDRLNDVKILFLIIQKYILSLSIAMCILTDPSGSSWYAIISILIYYLHLHILYEIFHNERHAMVAFARVSLFWGIFISIVAAIASSTNKKIANKNAPSASSSSSSEANFLAGLAGLLLFGIFIAVFDVCWFFSDNPAKKRLIFFVILVNSTYIGGCFYMFNASTIMVTLCFTVSLVHCQMVFNQIIDCVLYGDVDQYLDLPIPNRFFTNSYFQSFCGMTNTNNLDVLR